MKKLIIILPLLAAIACDADSDARRIAELKAAIQADYEMDVCPKLRAHFPEFETCTVHVRLAKDSERTLVGSVSVTVDPSADPLVAICKAIKDPEGIYRWKCEMPQ